ncbi:MAG: DUF2851 family protein [Chitinophagaceae bacterium]|nr:DUF2851 family protein [Chitinophagaceae bacterium]
MTERLLQFIWQFQYFNTHELETTAGDRLQIVYSGQWNNHQGPDFSDARVRVADKVWAGNVELHLLASDWHRHAHHTDENYENVILHVVWINDDNRLANKIPTLVLEDRIPVFLLQQYESWMHSSAFIPCANNAGSVNNLLWISWQERLLVERLQRKCLHIRSMLDINNDHWEETLWWLLARNFGLSVNAGAFEELARSIPFKILTRHKTQIHQLEALLLGQAGLLKDDREDNYLIMLRKEYAFYKSKYGLETIHSPVHFLRMRPPAFPTVRLAQLAMLLHSSVNIFSSMLEADSIKELNALLEITANDYWHYHYTFGQTSAYGPKTLGAHMICNIIVNTVVPVVFAYGYFQQQEKYTVKAMDWLSEMAAEKNHVTRGFLALGIESRNAAASQALIELKTQYCESRRCLNCAIGNAILKGK